MFFLICVGLMPALPLYFVQPSLTTIVCIVAFALLCVASAVLLLSRRSEFDPELQVIWRHFGPQRWASIARPVMNFEKVQRILVAEGNRGTSHRIYVVLRAKSGGSRFVFSSYLYPGETKWAVADAPSLALARALAGVLGCKVEDLGFRYDRA